MRWSFAIFIVLVAGLSMPAPAWAFDTPKALMEAIYAPYISGNSHANPERFFSARLLELLGHHESSTGSEEIVGLTFDPFVDGQDALLHDVQIGGPSVRGDQAVVQVSFYNFDHPTMLAFSLVREGDEWLVDDIASFSSEDSWLFSWLLRFDPWAN